VSSLGHPPREKSVDSLIAADSVPIEIAVGSIDTNERPIKCTYPLISCPYRNPTSKR
jgi:hypothetical protein